MVKLKDHSTRFDHCWWTTGIQINMHMNGDAAVEQATAQQPRYEPEAAEAPFIPPRAALPDGVRKLVNQIAGLLPIILRFVMPAGGLRPIEGTGLQPNLTTQAKGENQHQQ